MQKIINLTIAISFVLTVFSEVTFAQNEQKVTFNLKEAQEYAVRHNYNALNSRLDIEAAKKQLNEIKATGLPQINGMVNYTDNLKLRTQLIPGEAFGGPPGSTREIQFGLQHTASYGINVSQLIFSASYLVGLKTSKIYLELSKLNKRKTELDIKETVTATYYLILAAEENKRLLQSSLDNMRQNYIQIKELYKEGFVEETDVDQLQISITKMSNELTKLERQIEINYKLLKFQMGIDLEQPITLTEDLESIIKSADISGLLIQEFNLKDNIDFQIISTQKKLAELSLKNERAKFLPNISAFASYQWFAMRDEFNFFDFNKKWYSTAMVGVDLQIPIFNGGSKLFKIQRAKVAVKQAQNAEMQVRQALLLEATKAKTNLESAYESYQTTKENMILAKKVYDKTMVKYKEGISSSMDVIQAHNQYLTAQGDYIRALMELLNAKNALDKLLNKY